MVCWLMAPNCYLNQYWLIITEVLWYSPVGKFTGNAKDIYYWYKFRNYQFNITAISARGQWVNTQSVVRFCKISHTIDLSLGHYSDVIMGMMASQITSLTIDCSTVYPGADQRKHQSWASLAFVQGIHQWPVDSLHKWPVTQKMFPLDDVTMEVLHQVRGKCSTRESLDYILILHIKIQPQCLGLMGQAIYFIPYHFIRLCSIIKKYII